MWQEILPYAHFQDSQVTVLTNAYSMQGVLLYLWFPKCYMDAVRRSGIVQKTHIDLLRATEMQPYVSDAVVFTTTKPTTPGGVFCIRAKKPACTEVTFHVSIPSAWAVFIDTLP
jgi:hypothetical protein